jgi:hypothetical protein
VRKEWRKREGYITAERQKNVKKGERQKRAKEKLQNMR